MENDMFAYHPDYRIIETRTETMPIKTATGWDTISFKHEVITGWKRPAIKEAE